jgi:hypothetical protein
MHRPSFGLNPTAPPQTLSGQKHRTEFLAELERRCGKSADYLNQIDAEDGPVIGIVGFDDYPLPGQFTYFSYGLHLSAKPEWIPDR